MYSNIRLIRACRSHWIQSKCRASFFPVTVTERIISTSGDKKEKVSDRATVTKSEAISFVEGVLEIPNPVVSAYEDPWGFLCNIQKKMKTSVPFTNLVYFNEHGAHNISLGESKRVVFSKQGGACFDVYPVVQAVLRHLGFDISLISSSLSTARTQLPVSHVGLLVKNVTYPGSLHLIEPGTSHPILEPVTLEFKRFSPEYQVGHYPVRFFKTGPGIMMCSPAVDANNVGKGSVHFDGRVWQSQITYRHEETLTSYDCHKVIEKIVNDSGTMPDMHDRLIIFGYSQGLPTSIVGNKFNQYGKSGLTSQPVIKTMKTNIEVIETMQEHFPQYSPDHVEKALKFWNP